MIEGEVYLHTSRDRHELADWLERELGVRFDVDGNHGGDDARAREFPDGFLYFRYVIEIDPGAPVAALLRLLWEHGIPAVASAEHEDELPERGGYKSRAIPWPRP
jgi:hypothetical protein